MGYVVTTEYGTWGNHINVYSNGPAQDIADVLGDFVDDYDVDAIEADYRTAINEALPPSVALSGNEFIGPAYDQDTDWTGYPVEEAPAGLEGETEGALDIKAIVESVDLNEIIERHEQWTIDQVADHLDYKTATANAAARKKLSSWGVKAETHKPHSDSGRVQARYNAREVEAAHKSRPGQGARTDKA